MGAFARAFAHVLRPFAGVLGREEASGGEELPNLIGNGTFEDSTGWVLGTSCTVDSGSLRCNNNAANVNNDYAVSLAAGTYRVIYDVVAQTQGNVIPQFTTTGATVSGTTNFNPITPGTFSTDIVVPDPITALRMRVTRSNALMDVRLDNIIVQQLA